MPPRRRIADQVGTLKTADRVAVDVVSIESFSPDTATATIRVESVPTTSLHQDPANVRRHPERNVEAIKASLARFGQQSPLVVDANDVVRKGNGTLQAAIELGWETIAVVRTPLAGTEATAYAIADNRTSDLAEWDDSALAETLRALQSEDFDLAAVGYQDDEVDAMIEGLAKAAVVESGPEDAREVSLPNKFEILVQCRDESHQRETFERLQAEGFDCRVITF